MNWKKITNPIVGVVTSHWKIVFYIVVGIVVLGTLYFSFSSISNAVERERQKRAEEIKLAVSEATQKLQTDAKNMEKKHQQENQKVQQQLNSISVQRSQIVEKISQIEKSVKKINQTRVSIETHEYTKSELDIKFHNILVRGAR
jgi:septal ring factor EnvC (AmiA/AmiB activator)